MPKHEGQPFMPYFWFRWRYDLPYFALCLGLAAVLFVKGLWFPGVMLLLAASGVPVQGHYAARRVRQGEAP